MPREHGAWAMLLQPFLGALVVLRAFAFPAIPALVCVLALFMIREPLIVLARQRWVWRQPHAETSHARKRAAVLAAVLALSGTGLLLVWPAWIVAALGFGAAALTVLAVYMTVRNRQRAAWFQALSAAGLSSSCLAATLGVTGGVPEWAWWWWALHAAHFLTGILVVHVRLEARIQARKHGIVFSPAYLALRREAAAIQGSLTVAYSVLFFLGQPFYAAGGLFSAAVHFRDLATAHQPRETSLAMSTVGKRALAVSIFFTLLLIAGAIRLH
jgi:hypothetical protein